MIAAVVVHGFWIAWRARREPLRLNIVRDMIPEDYDEESRFRGELPNGGARIKRDPEQVALDLEQPAPMLLDTTGHLPAVEDVDGELFGDAVPEPKPRSAASARHEVESSSVRKSDTTTTRRPVTPQGAATIERAAARARVREVRLEPEVGGTKPVRKVRPRAAAASRLAHEEPPATTTSGPEELLVMYVLASNHEPFPGKALHATLRAKGLRYGSMNIFHRLDPMSKVTQYSVANAVEPGTFDMSEIESFSTPGLTFFLRLPGPQQPQDAFDDMWRVARDVAAELGGELKDDRRSAITAQTIEHYRERILDFSRRTLSRRA